MRYIVQKIAFYILIFATIALSADYYGEFVQNATGNLAITGLNGFNSTPARIASPEFGVTYAHNNSVDEQVIGASGEFGFKNFRIAFGSSYLQMDSIYRQVYSEVDASIYNNWLVAGMGYGFSAEWVPKYANWSRHRLKSGLTFMWNSFSVSAMCAKFVDAPLNDFYYSVGASVKAGSRFAAFVEYDGTSLDIGSAVYFKYISINSAYRFPDFGVTVSVNILLGSWSLFTTYGFASKIWDWFGVGISKKVYKKSIL